MCRNYTLLVLWVAKLFRCPLLLPTTYSLCYEYRVVLAFPRRFRDDLKTFDDGGSFSRLDRAIDSSRGHRDAHTCIPSCQCCKLATYHGISTFTSAESKAICRLPSGTTEIIPCPQRPGLTCDTLLQVHRSPPRPNVLTATHPSHTATE